MFFKEFFDHENIISIIDLQKPVGRTGDNDIYIITDLMETDLHRVIYSRQVTSKHILLKKQTVFILIIIDRN